MLTERPNDTRVRGAGPARKTFLRLKACKAPHPLQPIVRRPTASACARAAEREGAEAPPGRDAGAHRRDAHPCFVVQRLARDSRAVRRLAGAGLGLLRGGDSRYDHLGQVFRAR